MLTMQNLNVVPTQIAIWQQTNVKWCEVVGKTNCSLNEMFNVIEAAKIASTTCALNNNNFVFIFPSSLPATEQLEYVETRDSWLFKWIGCVQSVHITIYEWTLRRYCQIIWWCMVKLSWTHWNERICKTFFFSLLAIPEKFNRTKEWGKWIDCKRRNCIGCQTNEVECMHCVFGYLSKWYHRRSDQGNHWKYGFAYVWMW